MGDLSRFIPSWTHLLIIPGLVAGYTTHELAHTLVAYLLGDRSQAERGRITLNPFRHISWFGTLTFVLFGFGWARPFQVDSKRFKRRYLGLFLVAISGAAGNLLMVGLLLVITLALAFLVAVFSTQNTSQVFDLLLNADSAASPDIVALAAAFTIYSIQANLALAFFNLLPFPTLDGFVVIASLIGMLRENGTAEVVNTSPAPQASTEPGKPSGRQGSRRRLADIHFDLGAKYHAAGEYEDAIARYRQAIATDANYGPAYVNLGLVHLALDQRKRAIQAFRGATQLASDDKSKHEAWAQLHKLSELHPLPVQSGPTSGPDDSRPAPMETGPWTQTGATPNWVAFGLGSALTVAAAGCLYIYLAIGLIHYLS
jgi:Zn-dependent protease